MASNCEISSSPNHTNFILENVDLESIRLLNNQAYLTYDGTRIKWAQDFPSLNNFVKNVAGLSGEWESPGGRAKRFKDSNLDFAMTWYPRKLNSLIFHGKEGESFKKFLVRILQTNSVNQTDAITDTVLNTTTKTSLEPKLLSGDLDETTNNTSTHINSSVYNGHCCDSRFDSKVLKDIKSDVAALQTQMNSVNAIIDSTNAIIESMSAILIPSGPESGRVSYDLRLETFLQEFSVILKEKNKTITNLQEKLIQVENERDLLKFASQNLDKNTPAKSIINEPLKQKSNQSNGNANLDINIQSADLNKENNRSLYIPLHVTSANGVLLKSVNNSTDSMSDESFKPRNHNKLSEILINKHPKQRASQDVESIQPSGKLSTPNTKINFVVKHNRHKIAHDKAEHVPLEKRKKNPFRKHYFRNKPPSLLRRPTKDWLNHLNLVHLITTDSPHNNQFLNQKNLHNGQYQFESRTDFRRKRITFLPLVGAVRY